jgi:hypothetical protein
VHILVLLVAIPAGAVVAAVVGFVRARRSRAVAARAVLFAVPAGRSCGRWRSPASR